MPADSSHTRSGSDEESRDRYARTKRDFEDMTLEQQASFLVEASASAMARGLEHAGRHIANELDGLFRQARSHSRSSDTSHQPGAAEPETSQRTAPR